MGINILKQLNNVVRNWFGFGLTTARALDIRPEIIAIGESITYQPHLWTASKNRPHRLTFKNSDIIIELDSCFLVKPYIALTADEIVYFDKIYQKKTKEERVDRESKNLKAIHSALKYK